MGIIAFIVTAVAGYLGSALFYEWMNWPQAGPVFAVAVMGCFILRAVRGAKKQSGEE